MGVGIARLFGPLNWARALIGTLALPAVVAAVLLFVPVAIARTSGNWQVYPTHAG
jgi:hypothetical protein